MTNATESKAPQKAQKLAHKPTNLPKMQNGSGLRDMSPEAALSSAIMLQAHNCQVDRSSWQQPREQGNTSDRKMSLAQRQALVVQMQATHGNRYTNRWLQQITLPTVQRCGPHPCDCSPEERAAKQQ